MNKKIPFAPNETDAILYVIISVLLLMSVNQVLSKPQASGFLNRMNDTRASQLADETRSLYFGCQFAQHSFVAPPCKVVIAMHTFGETGFFAATELFATQAPNPFTNVSNNEVETLLAGDVNSRDGSSNVDHRLRDSLNIGMCIAKVNRSEILHT